MKMFVKITSAYGKAICLVLYAVFSGLLAQKIWAPFVILVVMHIAEFFIIGYKVGKENGIGVIPAFVNCLCFGFTWWLPVKSYSDAKRKQTAAAEEVSE